MIELEAITAAQRRRERIASHPQKAAAFMIDATL